MSEWILGGFSNGLCKWFPVGIFGRFVGENSEVIVPTFSDKLGEEFL